MNSTIDVRKKEISQLAANKALALPFLPSGFWFHSDIRDNFYFAVHLFAYCVDKDLGCEWSSHKREVSKNLALHMIGKVMSLQMKNPNDHMYGHWPLDLGSDPYTARLNPLPVELMGCLIILFQYKYRNELPPEVNDTISEAISHIYESGLYRGPIIEMYHHDAKHTSLKLLFGHLNNDSALTELGLQCAKQQLRHIRRYGFKEYGILPWHWHWIQSFTCVWEIVENAAVREIINELLDYLWQYRADYYLKGTWVGAQSRQWPHDACRDNNTLMDYIQFGNFPLPSVIPRLEGAALYTYRVVDDIVERATVRSEPIEVKRKIQFAKGNGLVTDEAHTYAYITSDYAVGGIWERRDEFDNEQHRWDITIPFTETNASHGGNQAFFFHPGDKYVPGDDRHASSFGEVLFHKDTAMQLWAVPTGAFPSVIGCLPLGEWKFESRSGYGWIQDAYVTFQLMNEFEMEEREDRISIKSPFVDGCNGVVMEVISCKDAASLGFHDLDSFIMSVKERNTSIFTAANISDSMELVSAAYTTWRNEKLQFTMDNQSGCTRLLNDQTLIYSHYPIQ